jgi:hypothetical protein
MGYVMESERERDKERERKRVLAFRQAFVLVVLQQLAYLLSNDVFLYVKTE